MFMQSLGRLLRSAGAGPAGPHTPYLAREYRNHFYGLRSVILRKWGMNNGVITQLIENSCYACNGTGKIDDRLCRAGCDHGVYSRSTSLLRKWRIGTTDCYELVEGSWSGFDKIKSFDLVGRVRRPENNAREVVAAMSLGLMFDVEFFKLAVCLSLWSGNNNDSLRRQVLRANSVGTKLHRVNYGSKCDPIVPYIMDLSNEAYVSRLHTKVLFRHE